MKKIISKILIIFIIMIILFEFSFSSNISHAMNGPDSETVNQITNLIGGVVSIVLWIPRIYAFGITWILDKIMTKNIAESCGINDGFVNNGAAASPYDIFFNKFNVFDVNFFNMNTRSPILNTIRGSVAGWFYVLRNISAIILLCVLIYVGIRMALSSVADEKAKYKTMLWDWVCSLILIFVLQYIAIFTIEANNILVKFLRTMASDGLSDAMSKIAVKATLGMGIGSIAATLVFCIMVFQTFFFMLAYIQRMLKVGFLILISPLISVTYSIDKIGDGKAQALNAWLKEFVYTILIQPFHCIMYLAFVNTAVKILTATGSGVSGYFGNVFGSDFNQLANGVIVILCLIFIKDGEKVIRKIFNFRDDSSLTSMAAGAALGMAAVSNAKKIGSSTAKVVNKGKSFGAKFSKARSIDKANNLGGQLKSTLKNAKDAFGETKLGKATEKIKNSKAGQVVGKAGKKVSSASKFTAKQIGKANKKVKDLKGKLDDKKKNFKKNHEKLTKFGGKAIKGAKTLNKKSMSKATAMMGAAMTLAAGGGALEALGTAKAMEKGTQEYFASSHNNLVEHGKDQIKDQLEDAKEYEDISEKLNDNEEKTREVDEKLDNLDKYIDNAFLGKRNKSKKNGKKGYNGPKDAKAFLAEREKIRQETDPEKRKKKEEKLKAKVGENLYNKFEERDKLLEDKKALADEKSELESRKKEIENLSTASGIQKAFKNNGGVHQIQQAKSDLLKAVFTLKAYNDGKNDSEDDAADSNNTFELSEDDQKESERMFNKIVSSVDRATVGTGGKFDADKFVKENYGDSGEAGQKLASAIKAYQFQRRAAEYNSTRSNFGNLGGFSDKYDDDCLKGID